MVTGRLHDAEQRDRRPLLDLLEDEMRRVRCKERDLRTGAREPFDRPDR